MLGLLGLHLLGALGNCDRLPPCHRPPSKRRRSASPRRATWMSWSKSRTRVDHGEVRGRRDEVGLLTKKSMGIVQEFMAACGRRCCRRSTLRRRGEDARDNEREVKDEEGGGDGPAMPSRRSAM